MKNNATAIYILEIPFHSVSCLFFHLPLPTYPKYLYAPCISSNSLSPTKDLLLTRTRRNKNSHPAVNSSHRLLPPLLVHQDSSSTSFLHLRPHFWVVSAMKVSRERDHLCTGLKPGTGRRAISKPVDAISPHLSLFFVEGGRKRGDVR